MLSRIQKWGNSQGVRIPKNVLENSEIEIGEEIEISVEDGSILLKPTHKIHGKYDIKNLVAEMPANYETKELDWDEPREKEEW